MKFAKNRKFLSINVGKFTTFLIFLNLAVLSLGVLITSYLGNTYSETLSYNVDDGWCNTQLEGIGRHCFGDFYAPITVANAVNPWKNDLNLAYSPVGFAYFRILGSDLVTGISSFAPLVLNLVFTILALLIPGMYTLRKNSGTSISALKVFALSTSSAPILMLIDRGNSAFALFPLMFFYYLGIRDSNAKMTSLSFILMVLWKPQCLLLILGIYIFFKFSTFLKALGLSVFGLVFSFILYPINLKSSFLDWISNSRDYQNYVPIPSLGNYSLVNFFGLLKNGFYLLFNPEAGFKNVFLRTLSPRDVTAICLLYALAITLSYLLNKKQISRNFYITSSSVYLLTLSGTTFGYYLVLLLIPFFIFEKTETIARTENLLDRAILSLYISLFFFMVPAWPFNWINVGIGMGGRWESLGVAGTFVHGITAILAILYLVQPFFIRGINGVQPNRQANPN